MQRLMHSNTFALHVGKEALQQGSSTARKFRGSSALIVAPINVCVGSTPAGLEPTAFAATNRCRPIAIDIRRDAFPARPAQTALRKHRSSRTCSRRGAANPLEAGEIVLAVGLVPAASAS